MISSRSIQSIQKLECFEEWLSLFINRLQNMPKIEVILVNESNYTKTAHGNYLFCAMALYIRTP